MDLTTHIHQNQHQTKPKPVKPPLQRQPTNSNTDSISSYGDRVSPKSNNNATNTNTKTKTNTKTNNSNSYSSYSNNGTYNHNLSASCTAESISRQGITTQSSIISMTSQFPKPSQPKPSQRSNHNHSRHRNASSSSSENELDKDGFAIPNRSMSTPRKRKKEQPQQSQKALKDPQDDKMKELLNKLIDAKHAAAILRKRMRTMEKEQQQSMEFYKRKVNDATLRANNAQQKLQEIQNATDDQYNKQFSMLRDQLKEMRQQRDAKEMELSMNASKLKASNAKYRKVADKIKIQTEYGKLHKSLKDHQQRNKQLTHRSIH